MRCVVDRLHADRQRLRDLAVGAAAGDELKDLLLAAGQHRARILDVAPLGALPRSLAHGAKNLGREVGGARLRRAHTLAQLLAGRALQEVPDGAGVQGGAHDVELGARREDQRLHRGHLGAQTAGRLDAVEADQRDVHEDDVGRELLGLGDDLGAALRPPPTTSMSPSSSSNIFRPSRSV
jgi:hypothetical protein